MSWLRDSLHALRRRITGASPRPRDFASLLESACAEPALVLSVRALARSIDDASPEGDHDSNFNRGLGRQREAARFPTQ